MRKKKGEKEKKKIPTFKNESSENEFWQENDSTNYIEWSKAKSIKLTKLKKTPPHIHK